MVSFVLRHPYPVHEVLIKIREKISLHIWFRDFLFFRTFYDTTSQNDAISAMNNALTI